MSRRRRGEPHVERAGVDVQGRRFRARVAHLRVWIAVEDVVDLPLVTRFLDALDAVSLESELGQEHFFDTFRLEEGSPFADLVTGMMGFRLFVGE